LSTPKLIYSYYWAENVVQQFTEKYARGCKFICEMSLISHKKLSEYLIMLVRSANQVNWEAMKRMIKACSQEDISDFKHLNPYERLEWLKRRKWMAQDEALDALMLQ